MAADQGYHPPLRRPVEYAGDEMPAHLTVGQVKELRQRVQQLEDTVDRLTARANAAVEGRII